MSVVDEWLASLEKCEDAGLAYVPANHPLAKIVQVKALLRIVIASRQASRSVGLEG
jgi:hypothetical protein